MTKSARRAEKNKKEGVAPAILAARSVRAEHSSKHCEAAERRDEVREIIAAQILVRNNQAGGGQHCAAPVLHQSTISAISEGASKRTASLT